MSSGICRRDVCAAARILALRISNLLRQCASHAQGKNSHDGSESGWALRNLHAFLQ
jgi:hypothetical protein